MIHKKSLTKSIACCVVLACFITPGAMAQFDSENVSLNAQIDLGDFGSSSGNDCWGYVSPSGREYALMGLDNKVAFVEITDPDNPVHFASVNHSSTIWGDVKVYQDHCYIVTEARDSGVQVVDMSDIDNHNINLVRTLGDPGRSHNVAIDEVSGFLYTTGSRNGTDRTVIYDLSNPSNPTQVGTWGTYEHDMQLVTYTEGKYAGRQIMFGASEDRGLDIVDVTDKSNLVLMSRTPYPNVAYCHQVWTEDLHYLYANDELDSIQRTTVFDISDLENPQFLGDYSSGLEAIDHNQYIKNGFMFEADYKSGLRIYDLQSDPVNPTQVGYFDTYPPDNSNGFAGAWSCFPYFPSGTVIISDENRGLFIVDPSDAVGNATSTEVVGFNVATGTEISGGLPELIESDDSYLRYQSGFGQTLVDLHNSELHVDATTNANSPSSIDVVIESHIDEPTGTAQVSLWNYNTEAWDQVHSYSIGNTDSVETIPGIGASDYVREDGALRVKIKHIVFVPFLAFTFESFIDQVEITVQ